MDIPDIVHRIHMFCCVNLNLICMWTPSNICYIQTLLFPCEFVNEVWIHLHERMSYNIYHTSHFLAYHAFSCKHFYHVAMQMIFCNSQMYSRIVHLCVDIKYDHLDLWMSWKFANKLHIFLWSKALTITHFKHLDTIKVLKS